MRIISTASRTHGQFAQAVEMASNLQAVLGMGRLFCDSRKGACAAELEQLPQEGWVPAGSWASHLPTPVQVSESASNLNYQLQQELPNLLTAPISSGACFSTVAGTVSLLQWEPPKWKMRFVLLNGKGISAHILKGAPEMVGVKFQETGSRSQVQTFKISALLLLRTAQQQEAQLTQKEELEGDILETILLWQTLTSRKSPMLLLQVDSQPENLQTRFISLWEH